MKRSKWILLPLVLLVSASAVRGAGAARKADARTLLGLAETGLSQTVRAAQASGGQLDPSRPGQRPFWSALDKMGAALQRVRTGMAARDSSFFRALEDGSADLAELKVAWVRTGVPNATVDGALRVLSTSYGLLRTGYGREAVRYRMGSGLQPAERARFLRIQRTQERLAQVLRDLEERARRRGDEAMRAELRRMAEEAWRVASARVTLDAFLNSLMISDAQRGEWTANTQYASVDDRSEWLEAGAVVEDLYVEADIGQVFMVDLGDVRQPAAPIPDIPAAAFTTLVSPAMSYLDEPTEIPEELAAVTETYLSDSEVADGTDEIDEVDEIDDVDAVDEEEALAAEEMTDEAGTGEDADLAVYEDIEDPTPADSAEEVPEEEPATDISVPAAPAAPAAPPSPLSPPSPDTPTKPPG